MARLLIVAPDGIEILNKYLSLDLAEGKFVSITPSTMDYPEPEKPINPELKEIIQRGKWAVEFLDEKREQLNPDFDKVRFENAKSKKNLVAAHASLSKPTELMVLAKNSLSAEDLKDIEETFKIEYAPRYGYSCITIQSFEFTEITDESQKVVFFVSGKGTDEFAKVITKEKADTKIITGAIDDMDIELAEAIKDPSLKLLVINGSFFTKDDTYYFTRSLKTVGYSIQSISLTPSVEKEIVPEKNITPTEPSEEKDAADVFLETHNALLEKISIISKELTPELAKKPKESLYKFSVRVLSKRLQMKPKNITEELFNQNKFRKRLFAAAEKDNHITAEERKFLEDGFGIE